MSDQGNYLLEEAWQLIGRLERISADSIWARRASGHRGALLKWVEQAEMQRRSGSSLMLSEDELRRLQILLQASYTMIENAAREALR